MRSRPRLDELRRNYSPFCVRLINTAPQLKLLPGALFWTLNAA